MDLKINRRKMIQSTLAATAGLSVGKLANVTPSSSVQAAQNNSNTMPFRILGKTGHQVSLFSLGGETTVEQRDNRDKAVEIINKALDLGVNYIDTSHVYGGGGSEENIGLVMEDRRDEVLLATKSGRNDYDGVMRECEVSLERLRTDYIDVYQHHNVRGGDLNEIMEEGGALEAFKQLKDEGVIRHIGITSHSPRVLVNALEQYDYECVLITLNPAGMSMSDTAHLDEFFSKTRENNVGVIAMKVAGKGGIFGRGINMQQAFTYTLSFPVSTAIVGITEPEQIDENVEIARNFLPLNEAGLKEIEDVVSG